MHYLLTNASTLYLDHLQRTLSAAGKPFTIESTQNGLTLIMPEQKQGASASWLDWDGITHLSTFTFVSIISDVTPALQGIAPLTHDAAFAAVTQAAHTEGVTGGANAYKNHFAESAAYTPRPPAESERIHVLDTVEGYDKIFSRKYDPAAEKRGDTSYATRYNTAPYLTMKRLKQAIDRILAARPDKAAPFIVYDFGCGHGRFLLPLLQYLRHKELRPLFLAYDPAPFALKTLREELALHNITDEVLVLQTLDELKAYKGKADLVLSMAGSLQYVEPQNHAAALACVRETLAPHGLLVGTGPSILTRYRESSISRLDMRLATHLFADSCAAIPSLLDAAHERFLPPEYVLALKQNKKISVAEVACKYNLSLVELAIQLAELRFQERALGHSSYVQDAPYMTVSYRAEHAAPDINPEWSGNKILYTRWMYELHSPRSLQEWLAREGFQLETLLADCVNHNDVAAKDPVTVQQ